MSAACADPSAGCSFDPAMVAATNSSNSSAVSSGSVQFQLQRFIIRFQLGKLFGLLQNQVDQFFFTQLIQFFLAHLLPILPNFSPVFTPR